MRTMPYVIKNEEGRDYQYDIFSLLLKDRIIFLNGVIDDNISDSVIAQLLYLNSVDSEKEISLYINSPGGSVSSGLAIYDTIRFIKAPVHTIAMGLAASMASLLLASGDKRSLLPHTKVMIHQPLISGGLSGQCTDIKIQSDHLLRIRERMNTILAENTGKPLETIQQDTERDNYMTAQEAMDYGLIDKVITKR